MGLILLCVIGFFLFRRRQKKQRPQEPERSDEKRFEDNRPISNVISRQELEAGQRHELSTGERKRELGANQEQPWELEAREEPGELEGRQNPVKR